MTAPKFPEIELALTSAALAGDAGGLYRIAGSLMDEGIPFDSLLFDYLMATERSVGQRWAQGDYLIAEEHAVTAAIETVIALLTGMLDQPEDAPLVVIATVEGDTHSLPARAVSAHLLFLGFRTTFLGADLPARGLRDFLEIELPVALVLSAAMSTHLLGARAVIEASHQVGVPVLVGGKAFGEDGKWARDLGADRWVARLGDVADVVEAWAENPPEIGAASQLPPDVVSLVENRTEILARADRALGSNPPARLREEVRLLLSAVESALLTGDDGIIVEMLDWQQASLEAHDMDPSSVRRATEEALNEFSEPGREALSRSTDDDN